MKVKIEGGLLWDAVEGTTYLSGPFLNLEPKLKISRNAVLGLRLGAAINTQRILNSDPNLYYIENEMGINSATSVGTSLDYYLSESPANPYIGFAISYYLLNTSKKGFILSNASEPRSIEIENQLGYLLRAGLNLPELGQLKLNRFILGMEFHYIPKAQVNTTQGDPVGNVAMSNLALSIGHLFGSTKS